MEREEFLCSDSHSSTSINSSNIGFQLLKKHGWKEGTGLGLSERGRIEPVQVHVKKNKQGLGADKVKKLTPMLVANSGPNAKDDKEIKTVELVKPSGWVYISLYGNDPRETFVNTFMLQVSILSNPLNGRDTHVRQIKVYGPRPNPIPHQPFQFTSREFITYSTVR